MAETFSEGPWAVNAVIATQSLFSPLDEFLIFVSEATNPASVLHYLVPALTLWNPPLAIQALAAYVIGDTTNLMLKWPAKGDRPYWMDDRVRQFGGSTCEIGWGMPSGHMQVTVAVYTILSVSVAKSWFTSVVTGIVVLTAISRVHMGAHTPLQVCCGLVSGLITAYAVMKLGDAIKHWSLRQIGALKRITYATMLIIAIAGIIIFEFEVLSFAGMDPNASIHRAKRACNGGIHHTVATGKGIARDCGAVMGAAVGRSIYYAFTPRGGLAKGPEPRKWYFLLFAWLACSEVALRVLSHIEVQGTRHPLGSGEVGVAFFSGLKYCILTALATGGYAVVIGSTRGSAVASEFDLTRRGGVE